MTFDLQELYSSSSITYCRCSSRSLHWKTCDQYTVVVEKFVRRATMRTDVVTRISALTYHTNNLHNLYITIIIISHRRRSLCIAHSSKPFFTTCSRTSRESIERQSVRAFVRPGRKDGQHHGKDQRVSLPALIFVEVVLYMNIESRMR